jgi:hypothetical protein
VRKTVEYELLISLFAVSFDLSYILKYEIKIDLRPRIIKTMLSRIRVNVGKARILKNALLFSVKVSTFEVIAEVATN